MKNPLVSVLIINWNGEKILPECLKTILNQEYKNIEVIVVDNNSSDNSVAVIKQFKQVKIIKSSQNLGFAGGNNLGVTKAKGKYVLLLNTDTNVPKDFLKKLVDVIENDDAIGVVQPKILYEDKTINSLGGYLTTTGFLYYPGYGKMDTLAEYKKQKKVFTAFGACMLVRKEVIDTVGLFDDDYFMYFEETDFCMRVWLAGWQIVCVPKTYINHKGAVSSKKFGMERIYFHSFKNRICTYIKNLDGLSLLTILPLHLAICEGISFVYLFTGKAPYFLAVQKSIFWNIAHFSKTLQKRKKILRNESGKNYLSFTSYNPRLSYYLYLFKGLQYYKD